MSLLHSSSKLCACASGSLSFRTHTETLLRITTIKSFIQILTMMVERFQVSDMNTTVFWRYQCFGGICCFHFQSSMSKDSKRWYLYTVLHSATFHITMVSRYLLLLLLFLLLPLAAWGICETLRFTSVS
jgi:hypothetical protein